MKTPHNHSAATGRPRRLTRRWLAPSTESRLLLIGVCFLAGVCFGAVDRDDDGLSDVYEFIYFNAPAEASADSDGDGFSNYEEMIWGANPTNAASKVTGATATLTGTNLVLTWPFVEGKWYRLQSSSDLVVWQTITEGHIASYTQPLTSPGGGSALTFWRVQVVKDAPDSDGNGLDDWEDALWASSYGANPSQTDIDGDGLPDAQEFSLGHSPGRRDHPAVGLVVFTPLEK